MFVISTPISNPTPNSRAGFIIAGDSPNTPIVKTKSNDDYVPVIVVPDIDDNTIIIPSIPDKIATSITINGITHTFTLNAPPGIGKFTEINGEIIIGYAGIKPAVINVATTPLIIATDMVPAPYPDLFTRWPLVGQISWSMGFEEQPSANFEFITDAVYRDQVISYFAADMPVEIYGTAYSRSATLSITDIATNVSVNPLISVKVDLTGSHVGKLDNSVELQQLPNGNNPCISPTPTPAFSGSVADIAARAGVGLVGGYIPLPAKLLESATSTTLASVLDNNAIRSIAAYIDYNRSGAIHLIPWSSSGGISALDVAENVTTTVRHLPGSIYTKLYDPPVKVTYGSNATADPNSPITQPNWPTPPPEDTTVVEGDEFPDVSPYFGTQKDLSIVFDVSGKRKRRKITTLHNGQPLREEEREYGYVAVARDHVVFTGDANPVIDRINGSWQVISSRTKNYTYNNLGYLKSVDGYGFVKTRFNVENAQKPESVAINLGANNDDPIALALLDTYRFFNLSTYTSETYELTKLRDYYNDIKPATIRYTLCLPEGGSFEMTETDPNWIEPYFVSKSRTIENSFAATVNPKSTALKPLPQLTTGKKSEFIERTQITTLPFSFNNPKNPEYYTKSTDNYSSSGAQFNAILAIADSQIVKGRPPTAPSRNATDSSNPTATPPPAPTANTNKPFGIYSLIPAVFTPTNTIDYPNAATETQALLAAKTDLEIINTKNCRISSVKLVNFTTGIYPGQTLNYRVGNSQRSGRIMNVSQTLKIQGIVDNNLPIITHSGTTLSVGEQMNVPVTSYKLAN